LFANYTLNRDMISPILHGDPNSKIYTQITGNLDQVHAAYLGSSWSDEITPWWQTNTTLMLTGTYVNSPVADVPSLQIDGYGFNFSSTNIFHLPNDWQTEITFNYSSANQWMAWKTGA